MTLPTPTKEVVEVAGAPTPFAGAPYSQLIRYGDLLFSSGQVAEDAATGKLVGTTIEEQTEKTLSNLRTLLDGAGSGLANVLRTQIFLADLADWPGMNEVYGRFFDHEPPARAAVQVGLPEGVLIEIEVIAHV
jgi:2-iminobutanoate/2-iminopropanoate deaminase